MKPKPRKVIVGGLVYKIRWQDPGEGDLGSCSPDKALIQIKPGMPRSVEANTLLHEILHACVAHVDAIPSDYEERAVLTLANEIQAVIRSNPRLARGLLKALVGSD